MTIAPPNLIARKHGITDLRVIDFLVLAEMYKTNLSFHASAVEVLNEEIRGDGVLADPRVGLCLIEIGGDPAVVGSLYNNSAFAKLCYNQAKILSDNWKTEALARDFVKALQSVASNIVDIRSLPLSFDEITALSLRPYIEWEALTLLREVTKRKPASEKDQVIAYAKQHATENLKYEAWTRRQASALLLLEVARDSAPDIQENLIEFIGDIIAKDPHAQLRELLVKELPAEMKYYSGNYEKGWLLDKIFNIIKTSAESDSDTTARQVAVTALGRIASGEIKGLGGLVSASKDTLQKLCSDPTDHIAKTAKEALAENDKPARLAREDEAAKQAFARWKAGLSISSPA